MIGTIIYVAGIVLCILAVIDVLKKNISLPWKIIWVVLLLITSWIGLIIYYLFLKDNITKWCK